ncbi:unnamed protein product [Linum tenue]|uniref:Uncharacterized protein n=1 Tax=Linum tenue TaxID=586396 RepID=A0AAV0KWE6_9ROSI|nr:unnamed protein product [Linum tenue]
MSLRSFSGALQQLEKKLVDVSCVCAVVHAAGKVRVKTKKQSEKLRTRSISTRRPTPGGEGSFKRLDREIDDGNNAAEFVF